MLQNEVEQLFAGLIGEHYELLKIICPAAPDMSRRVGEFVATWQAPESSAAPLKVVELGAGTGITSIALLSDRDDIHLHSVDSEPTMLKQARVNLARWLEQGRLTLVQQDALSALQQLPDAGVDLVASAYTMHNFFDSYRSRVWAEIFRVLKPGGGVVNGDRYALDDVRAHCELTRQEMQGYFREFGAMERYDLLEQWILHLYGDESPDHIMRYAPSLQTLRDAGFVDVQTPYREGVNALVSARKPG
ncbi:MAG: class I SAM-dependent methyltransferase [Methylococcaceae bacterium]|nr:MAG: class I SAM-dependent methyltransferase [Methylococcaceae bacterium]